MIMIAIVSFLVVFVIMIYNSLIGRRNQVQNAFSSIDVYLKKRYDLIPNLVESLKQYMHHEKNTLEKVIQQRNQALQAKTTHDSIQSNQQISQLLGGLMLQVEAYPELKADAGFRDLQKSLNEIEEQLSAARRAYNASVLDLNNLIEKVPSNIIASIFNFQKAEMFQVEDAAVKQTPNLKQMFNS